MHLGTSLSFPDLQQSDMKCKAVPSSVARELHSVLMPFRANSKLIRMRACCLLPAACYLLRASRNISSNVCAHPVHSCCLRSGSLPTDTVELSHTTLNARKGADKGMHVAYSHDMAMTLAACVRVRTRTLTHVLIAFAEPGFARLCGCQ
jgi:hypothetical protein